jgi:hypothetical protein
MDDNTYQWWLDDPIFGDDPDGDVRAEIQAETQRELEGAQS